MLCCLSASHVVVAGWEDEDVLIVGYSEEPSRKRKKVTDEGVWTYVYLCAGESLEVTKMNVLQRKGEGQCSSSLVHQGATALQVSRF